MVGKHKRKKHIIAIAGNPNTGKSSIFNALTGGNQHVGNWPGVTVERKEGILLKDDKQKIILVDLPGIYSLRAKAEDEIVASRFLIQDKPELTIVVLDASHLERSLYLLLQVRELGQKVVAVLNMSDLAADRGVKINTKKLAQELGCPIVSTSANKAVGVAELKRVVLDELGKKGRGVTPAFSGDMAELLDRLSKYVPKNYVEFPDRTAVIKLIEGEKSFVQKFATDKKLMRAIEDENNRLVDEDEIDLPSLLIEERWNHVGRICSDVVERTGREDVLSRRIDKVATHKWFGIPLFFAVVFLMFYFTYHLADPFVGWLEDAVAWASENARVLMAHNNVPGIIQSLVTDGVIAGVGAVIVFFPNIFLLFFFLAILEGSGYLARGTFVMDRFMNWMGLHGKSFIPMIMGFGCGVPALMGTRILDQKRDRLITMLTIPFISCSARLPVFVLFAGAFFPKNAATVIFSLYIIGIIMAIAAAKVFSLTLFKKSSSMLVMELPTYHIPSVKEAVISGWRRSSEFLKKAATVIMLAVIVIWGLGNLPVGVEYASKESYIGQFGQAIAPIFEPAGFGAWQSAVALFFGFMAKEVVIGTFGTILNTTEAGLGAAIGGLFTPLSAYAFLVMVLLYVPCLPALMVFKREAGAWKWVLFLIAYTTVLGWCMATVVYQVGRLFL